MPGFVRISDWDAYQSVAAMGKSQRLSFAKSCNRSCLLCRPCLWRAVATSVDRVRLREDDSMKRTHRAYSIPKIPELRWGFKKGRQERSARSTAAPRSCLKAILEERRCPVRYRAREPRAPSRCAESHSSPPTLD